MIELRNVCKSYDKTKDTKSEVLINLNLKIYDGEFLCIKGKSGSGKSTLLNIISCMDSIDKGEYILDGEHIQNVSNHKLDMLRKNNFGFVFQNYELINDYTIKENVEMPLIARRIKSKTRNKIIDDVLKMFGIFELRNKYPKQLSGGEQQRAAIARAYAIMPKYLVADEPTGAVDTSNAQTIMQCFEKIHNQGHTIIMVTHDDEMAGYASRIVNIIDGTIKDEV